jgi:ubiquinone/menaquinone biosynthesis C-methylase UbiE
LKEATTADTMERVPRHHDPRRYETLKRWVSYYQQIHEVLKFPASHVLEIGKGTGFMAKYLEAFHDIQVTTVDVDPVVDADRQGSVTDLPAEPNEFDVTLCAQVLEHLPYEEFPGALREIRRVSRRGAVISLPDCSRGIRISIQGSMWEWSFPWVPLTWPRKGHEYNGMHYWEIGHRGFPLKRIIRDIEANGFIVEETYRVKKNPYHRFFRLLIDEDQAVSRT